MNYISLLCNFFRLRANTQKAELKSYIYRKKSCVHCSNMLGIIQAGTASALKTQASPWKLFP